jgi:hypothetical protein
MPRELTAEERKAFEDACEAARQQAMAGNNPHDHWLLLFAAGIAYERRRAVQVCCDLQKGWGDLADAPGGEKYERGRAFAYGYAAMRIEQGTS